MHANIKISTLIGCGPVYMHVYVRVSVKDKRIKTSMLLTKYFKKIDRKPVPGITMEEKKRATEEMKQAMARQTDRGKYTDYSPEVRGQIGRYAAEHGATKASRHFTKRLAKNVPESTARRLKNE